MKQTAGVKLYYGVLVQYQRITRLKSNNSSPKATKQLSYTLCFSRRNRLLAGVCMLCVFRVCCFEFHLLASSFLSLLPVLFSFFLLVSAPGLAFFNSQIPQTAICLSSTHLVLDLLFSHVFALTTQSLASCCSSIF